MRKSTAPSLSRPNPALQSIVDSIERLGLEEPLIVTTDNYILSGHRRFVAVQHLGWAQVPVRFSKVRRDQSTDYHRLLAQYNPQRVKSVAVQQRQAAEQAQVAAIRSRLGRAMQRLIAEEGI
jgi:hypothetical protein